jgi:hypothetical protein
MAARAAEREQRLHQSAAAPQVVNEASDDDHKKQGWFSRWRERRKRNKLPASEMSPTDELVVVEVAGSQPEAEMLCSLLRSAGIACMPRLTSRGAGAGDGLGIGGQHEIMVRSKDAQAARKILRRPGLTNLVTFT